MSRGLNSFLITIAVGAILAAVIMGPEWSNPFAEPPEVSSETSISPAEIEKLIRDYPTVMGEVDDAVAEYRNVGGTSGGEAAIRRGVQATVFQQLGWQPGRGEYLVSYLFMLRNSILKYSEQHSALGAFMEHYEQNDAVSPELRDRQVGEIRNVLAQINSAPDLESFPQGDIELMVLYFEPFHEMLVGYSRSRGFVSQFSVAE